MRIRQAGRYITFTAETQTERDDLEVLAGSIAGQQFRVDTANAETLSLRAAGPGKPEGGRAEGAKGTAPKSGAVPIDSAAEPINITFDAAPMPLKLIANLAQTAFTLDGRSYASVEGFWQGLKFPAEEDRERLAGMWGHSAKKAGPRSVPGDRIVYEEGEIVVGTVDHWALMERANLAKFEQHAAARAALLSTRSRPLVHRVPVDSRTIPGVIMADIWMRIRGKLAGG